MPPRFTLGVPDGFAVAYWVALACYGLALVAEGVAPKTRRWLLGAGLVAHTVGLVLRGVAIGAFPLTNKFESFYAFSLAVMATSAARRPTDALVERLGVTLVGAVFYGLTLLFGQAVAYPPPLMGTIWYPLHVPASFAAYALWTGAAASAVAGLRLPQTGERGREVHARVERQTFCGWALFSLSMIFGGAWGYVAWGAYFLWDPKLVWSVILWLFFAAVVHLKYWPAWNRPRPRAALAIIGWLVLLVAYVGTSFLFGHSSHSFG